MVGASYVALESAGFLRGLGYDVTLAVRSIFLRGFDQQMAELIGADLGRRGVKIHRPSIPTKVGIKILDFHIACFNMFHQLPEANDRP